jgi:hypothetical protein
MYEIADAIRSDLESHLRCCACDGFDLCVDCMVNAEIPTKHAGCPDTVQWNFWDPKDIGQEWLKDQLRQAKDVVAEAERRVTEVQAAAARIAAPKKKQEEEQAAAMRRKPVLLTVTPATTRASTGQSKSNNTANNLNVSSRTTSRVQAASPTPPRSTNLAPPPQRQAQRRQSTSHLGSFLRGQLQVTNAVLQAENNANYYSGGGGDGGGGNFNFVNVTDTSSSTGVRSRTPVGPHLREITFSYSITDKVEYS